PDPVYGVSTGFGALAVRHISPELRVQLQRNIVRSHAAGMGPRVEREVVRALMFLRLKTLASGHTGVRPLVVETMAALLNAGITPVVHEYGSLGCSGDLAPLSHCALALMGEGSADITAALSLEALLGTDKVLAPELHAIRPHPGQAASAANMAKVLAGSGFTGHHQDDAPRVQDAYSIRCAPQVAGAGRDTAAVDNPVVLPDGRVESNGNFHGAPVAYVLDFLAIAAADLGSIAERRTDRLLDKNRSHGLPAFLAGDPGVDSGLMIAQYTQAALVSELKRLAAPASVDSPAPATRAVLDAVRGAGIQGPGEDRFLAPDLESAYAFVRGGKLVAAAESVTGTLA
ncbi:histidine ammonia-lyase, partial [Streptomyces platensis subsp. clarensis]|nr:histidine ammonia-lyase [Streptomyces platensis subsp. clarensis]